MQNKIRKEKLMHNRRAFKLAGVLNSIYLGAARDRVWVRLGRIRFSAKQSKSPKEAVQEFP